MSNMSNKNSNEIFNSSNTSKICILSDFDGTITERDGLYSFIEKYAQGDWQKVEQDWANGKISSKKCLLDEFNLIPNLSSELIDNFVKTLNIDDSFVDFYRKVTEQGISFFIVSDGIDYFIKRILEIHGLNGIKVISNHGEFVNGKFKITFPNDNPKCINNSGTCKCSVLEHLGKDYDKIYYVGDGVSDFCIAGKADVLYAKKRLLKYCEQSGIKCIPYEKFKDIVITE